MSIVINGETFRTFSDTRADDKTFSEDERAAIEMEVAIMKQLVTIREKEGLSQRGMAKKVGLKQSAIARLEKQNSIPTLKTLAKILNPLGYTLTIVKKKKINQNHLLFLDK